MAKGWERRRAERRAFLEGIGVPDAKDFVPDAFQIEAIDSVNSGNDTLVVAPTGAGKTYVAVKGIESCLERGGRAIYTAPLKALSNAKYGEFKTYFEPRYSAGLLTGDRKIEGDASVVVATTEIYRNDLYRGRADYALVVLDEIHYLADPQRGPVWEESIILSPSSATLLMLSASISNPEEIASWIESIRGRAVRIVCVEKRPVELRYGFLHPEFGVIPLMDSSRRLSSEVSNCKTTSKRREFRRRRPKPGDRKRR